MATYLLLRDNKESGPYSLDDLTEMGLKAYDLVWIQGKSAAWRYPSEVEELKPIAPVVEEQPYDRFYKKPAEEKKRETPVQEIPVIAAEHEKYLPKKSVFVTMPGQKAATAQKTQPVQSIKKEEEKYTPPTPARQAIKEDDYMAQASVQQTITISENPAASQIKYSQPLDEIKEMYVKTLQDRKQKIARKSFWLQSLKKAAVVLSLVVVGVIAGFVIKSDGNKQQEIAQKPSQPQQVITEPVADVADTNTSTTSTQDVQTLHQPTGGYVNKEFDRQEKIIEPKQSIDQPVSNNIKKELPLTSSENKISTGFAADGVDIDPATGERNRKVRNENSLNNKNNSDHEKSSPANDISSMVSVTSNEYKKVAFGGIRDLKLTVTNNSKYTLDNVIVELQYLKPSEQPLKTENIQFKSIEPKTSSTIKIADTNRGIKVVYRIINIKSRQMDEGVAGN